MGTTAPITVIWKLHPRFFRSTRAYFLGLENSSNMLRTCMLKLTSRCSKKMSNFKTAQARANRVKASLTRANRVKAKAKAKAMRKAKATAIPAR